MSHVLTSVPVSNKADQIFLLIVMGEHTTILFIMSLASNLGPTSPVQVLKTTKLVESDD